jgi:hypothetical protein
LHLTKIWLEGSSWQEVNWQAMQSFLSSEM